MYYAKRKDDELYDWVGHTLDVAACLDRLLHHHTRLRTGLVSLIGCPEPLVRQWLVWAAIRHDLGKLTQSFQRMLVDKDHRNYTVRHDSLGWVMWLECFSDTIPEPLKRTAELLVRTTTGHHGSPPSESRMNQRITLYPHATSTDVDFARAELGSLDAVIPMPTDPLDHRKLQQATWWIAGATVVADWLGSNTEWFPYQPVKDHQEHWDQSLEKAETALAESGLIQTPLAAPCSIQDIDPSWETRPLQAAMQDIDVSHPVCVVVEDAMGAGKTEAALILGGRLIAAGQADRLYWALPTVATSNSLYERLAKYCPDAQRTLVHGYPVKLHAEHAAPWLLGDNRRRLFAALSAGTIDQVMLASMFSKYSVLRLMGLVGSVLVFDEIHAADGYMLSIIKALIEMHAIMGGSVILLSATLPMSYRAELIAAWKNGLGNKSDSCTDRSYPVLAHSSGMGLTVRALAATKTRSIRVEHCSEIQAATKRLLTESAAGRCAVWVCTTVDEAIERYLMFQAEIGNDAILFHSRYVADDRNSIERRVLDVFGKDSDRETRARKVLIATQVVEQSLDLDFDFMVTDAAPIDLVLQRVGRLHRHDRGDRGQPTLLLHTPGLDGDWNISAQYVYEGMMPHIWLSTRLALDKGRIDLPEDLRSMVEIVYSHSGEETPLGPLMDPQVSARAKGDLVAVRPKLGYDGRGNEWLPDTAFPTRLGERSQIVAIVDDDGAPIRGTLRGSAIRFLNRWPAGGQFAERDNWKTVRLNERLSYSGELGLQIVR